MASLKQTRWWKRATLTLSCGHEAPGLDQEWGDEYECSQCGPVTVAGIIRLNWGRSVVQ